MRTLSAADFGCGMLFFVCALFALAFGALQLITGYSYKKKDPSESDQEQQKRSGRIQGIGMLIFGIGVAVLGFCFISLSEHSFFIPLGIMLPGVLLFIGTK